MSGRFGGRAKGAGGKGTKGPTKRERQPAICEVIGQVPKLITQQKATAGKEERILVPLVPASALLKAYTTQAAKASRKNNGVLPVVLPSSGPDDEVKLPDGATLDLKTDLETLKTKAFYWSCFREVVIVTKDNNGAIKRQGLDKVVCLLCNDGTLIAKNNTSMVTHLERRALSETMLPDAVLDKVASAKAV